MVGFRTLEQVGRAGGDGNQGFQGSSERIVTRLVLVDARDDLGLLGSQGTRFFVVLVLCDSSMPSSDITTTHRCGGMPPDFCEIDGIKGDVGENEQVPPPRHHL